MPYSSFDKYRKAWEDAPTIDPSIPLNIDIELASLCNLTCPFCFISDGSFDDMIKKKDTDGKSRRRLMLKTMALTIIDQAAELGVPALKFNWRGESTLHPKYSEIISYARDKNKFHELLVNTNANCSQKAVEGLMATTKVMVSLDSMDSGVYKTMRRGGDLEQAKITIWSLVVQNHPNIWVRRVITKDNLHEDFYGDVRREWGEKVNISEHYCFDRNMRQSHEIVDNSHDFDRRYCGYPSQRIVFSASGAAYPCCIDLHQTMPVGHINQNTIKEIWHGHEMLNLREELRRNEFKSESCKNCQSWMSYKSEKRNFVQDRKK